MLVLNAGGDFVISYQNGLNFLHTNVYGSQNNIVVHCLCHGPTYGMWSMLAEAILNLEKLEMIFEIFEFFLRVAPRSARLQQIACTSSFLPSMICNLNNNYVMFYGSILVFMLLVKCVFKSFIQICKFHAIEFFWNYVFGCKLNIY